MANENAIIGLKKLRKAGGKFERGKHGNWGNPNKKIQKRIEVRQEDYKKNLESYSWSNRPGSHKG